MKKVQFILEETPVIEFNRDYFVEYFRDTVQYLINYYDIQIKSGEIIGDLSLVDYRPFFGRLYVSDSKNGTKTKVI